MTVEEAKKLFTTQELKKIEKSIKRTSERDADLLIGSLENYCADNIFESIKKLIAAGKTMGLTKIPTSELCCDIIIENVEEKNQGNFLIIKRDPKKEIKKLLLQYYPSCDNVISNALKAAIIDPDSDTEMHGYIISTEDEPDIYMDMHSYIRLTVDVYDEDPQSQTGEMYLVCRACKKCNVT